MGTDAISKYEAKKDIIKTGNLSMGRQANGDAALQPVFGTTDYCLMAGVGAPMLFSQGKNLFKTPQWYAPNGQLQNVSRWNFIKNNAYSQVRSWGNFNHMDFVNTKVQQLEGYINSNAARPSAEVFKKITASDNVKNLYNQLANAKTQREFNQIIQQNRADYQKLKNVLNRKGGNPKAFSQLLNSIKYKETYGKVLQEYQAAQQTMRMTGKLPQGQTFDGLSKSFADARLTESEYIKKATKGGIKKNWFQHKWARGTKWVKHGMAASKTLRTISRHAGKAGGAAAAVMTILSLGTEVTMAAVCAKDGEGWKDAGRQLCKSGARAGCELGGAFAGMKVGAMIGGCLGPVGAVVGGLVGSIAGWAIGSWAASKSDYMNTTVIEENQMKVMAEQNVELCKAIENDDIDTLASFIGQCYEYEMDENGQPKVDENGQPQLVYMKDASGQPILDADGNPQPKVAQVSDNEKIQKEYEQMVKKVTDYVNEKYGEVAQEQQYAQQPQLAVQEGAYQQAEQQVAQQPSYQQQAQEVAQTQQQDYQVYPQDLQAYNPYEPVYQQTQYQPSYQAYNGRQSYSGGASTNSPSYGRSYASYGSSYTPYGSKSYTSFTGKYPSYTRNNNFGSYTGYLAGTNNSWGDASWQNRAWQDSLADSYNNGNFYSFNPSNYTPLGLFSNQYAQYKVA